TTYDGELIAERTDSPFTTSWTDGLALVKKAKVISYKPGSDIRILVWSFSHWKLSKSDRGRAKRSCVRHSKRPTRTRTRTHPSKTKYITYRYCKSRNS